MTHVLPRYVKPRRVQEIMVRRWTTNLKPLRSKIHHRTRLSWRTFIRLYSSGVYRQKISIAQDRHHWIAPLMKRQDLTETRNLTVHISRAGPLQSLHCLHPQPLTKIPAAIVLTMSIICPYARRYPPQALPSSLLTDQPLIGTLGLRSIQFDPLSFRQTLVPFTSCLVRDRRTTHIMILNYAIRT